VLKALADKWGVTPTAPPAQPVPDVPPPPTPDIPLPEAPAPTGPSDAEKEEAKRQRAEIQAKIDKANRKIDAATADGISGEAEMRQIQAWKDDIKQWRKQLAAIPAYARGGYASTGLALVGEQGPEIVNFERPGQVYNAAQTREALSGSPKTFEALEAIKVEIAALVRGQSAANPEIINELRELRSRMDSIERTQRIKA
jgi:hypothetical protein